MSEKLIVDANLGKEAYEHAKNRLGFEYDRFHLATEQRLSMITIGTIGQLVFKKYLESKKYHLNFNYNMTNTTITILKSKMKLSKLKVVATKIQTNG